jgi:hypothetical protein
VFQVLAARVEENFESLDFAVQIVIFAVSLSIGTKGAMINTGESPGAELGVGIGQKAE